MIGLGALVSYFYLGDTECNLYMYEATYDSSGFHDFLDTFNDAVNNYTTLTVAAGSLYLFDGCSDRVLKSM